jgi:hypothetical protein
MFELVTDELTKELEAEEAELARLKKDAYHQTEHSQAWYEAWANVQAQQRDVDHIQDAIDKQQEEYWNEEIPAPEGLYYDVVAGSEFGCRYVTYRLSDGVLQIVDDTGHDNLAGNSLAADLAGMTLSEAQVFVKAKNDETDEFNADRRADGSHSFYWHISFKCAKTVARHVLM